MACPAGEFDISGGCTATRGAARKEANAMSDNKKLAEVCQMARQFVDDVSHEFRTPLTVIQGYCNAMSDGLAGPATDRQKEYLDIVMDRTRDLAQMIDDLQDGSKLRIGTMRMDRRAHDIESIMAPVRAVLDAKASANRVRLVERIDAGLPQVFADAVIASRVILSLVGNAIKVSPEGSEVTISASQRKNGDVEIAITDHGAGIFEQFEQTSEIQRSGMKGFGLGLGVARELVALNLGTIHVRSRSGSGSTFWFTLPAMDWEHILSRFFQQRAAGGDSAQWIALLRVAAAGDEGGERRSQVICGTDPRDLVLPAGDGSLLVLGLCDDPTQWASRLHGQIELEQELIGSWRNPVERDAARSAIQDLLQEAVAYA